jgi:glycosyltransferase involved in cell wall biosynthesis
MSDIKKILAWADSAAAGTGFGVVSNHILRALHNTGNYSIHHLAINHKGEFNDDIPWQVQPSRLMTPQEPHGMKMFIDALSKQDYDIVWILNDIYVTQMVAKNIKEVRDRYRSQGKKPPIFIYYFPVDCHVQAHASGMISEVDVAVCYTHHGREETIKTLPDIGFKLKQIPHGVDTSAYYPLEKKIRDLCKKRFYNVTPNTTVVINVNRNSTRKQIPYSMLAFKEFKKLVPDSVMYIHSVRRDQGNF